MELTFEAELWEWQGQGAWCFVSLPSEYFEDIRTIGNSPKRGFGSVRVECTVGTTSWKTSIFPDAKTKTYLLPVKKDVRKREAIEIGDTVTVDLRLLDV